MPKFYCIISLLFLAACNPVQDFSRLTFDIPVQANRGYTGSDPEKVNLTYAMSIINLLKEHDIDPKAVKMRVDRENSHTVILSIHESGSHEEKLESFEGALKDIVHARGILPLKLTLNVYPPSPDKAGSGSKTLEVLHGREVEVSLEGLGLSHTYGMAETLQDAVSGTQPQAEAFCSVTAKLSPALPFTYLQERARGAGENGRFTASTKSYSGEFHADLVFNDENLRKMVENQDVLLAMPFDSSAKVSMFKGHLNQIALHIGSVGTFDFSHAGVDSVTRSRLRNRCEDLAVKMGRPFTFVIGDSLDRLASVSSLLPH